MSAAPLPRRPAAPLTDVFHRPLKSLRISVTDRCNMRCRYCMPEQEYAWLPRDSILTFEEIDRLVCIFAGLGVDKLRLTGGGGVLTGGNTVTEQFTVPELPFLSFTVTT